MPTMTRCLLLGAARHFPFHLKRAHPLSHLPPSFAAQLDLPWVSGSIWTNMKMP